ncbi:LysR family transcriptional regulator [Achromobacter denitrificans]|uniref:LysR family transcriptional regulator n=1 Tax=Achromobacter denitrificans TaxID=32002 RepID=A0A6J5IBM3_ACHDE|nr:MULTISPECIES: LysR substrate-binding domain-containing protein [Achromobacter]MBV2161162.1 LysR family transcriptional regulator [Achromobacter denitrificans]MDF3852270.1 LysR substrate-binding domain-containing protein [Achromobacter denitrificans]MDF3941448.1 LysR substrate-binding domain-containing protein [Achromobacter denitrificans]MDX3880952.1 LysR substrate-binding domain-containing protein [Achromobacter sp.]QKQ46945.1 LysR family transcriptional regulator [Achromobacter denitrific
MELRQLRYFLRIVELGSMSKAAKDLYIAQPALSSQITNLESELGARLLSRSVRGVSPTRAGDALYLHAQAVLRQIERLKYDVANTDALPGGPVSVGLPTSAANVLAGPLIAAVQQRYPDIQLRIVESLSGHLQELVATGRLEISLLFEPAPGSRPLPKNTQKGANIQWVPLIDEDLYLLELPSGPQEASTASLEEASRIPLVLPGKTNVTRQIIERSFADAGLAPSVMMELDSLSTIQSIVESGQAATILSLSALVGAGVREKLSARSVDEPPLRRRLSLCNSDVLGMGAAAEVIGELIPELVRDLVASGRWAGAHLL